MTIYKQLVYLTKGGRADYHKNGEENKKATKLQNLLDKVSDNVKELDK